VQDGDLPAVTPTNRATRALEAKEIEAFYEGYERMTVTSWDFLVKLDGDLSFEPDYFEKCFEQFYSDPALGIGGGVICHELKAQLQVEVTPAFHVRGATKIYRRACWEAIGGVVRGPGWDTIDEVKANMLGWHSRSFSQLRVVHHRLTGTANGRWRNALKNGAWNYICGYHPLFLLAKCGKRALQRTQFVHSAGLLCGFALGWLRQIPRINDRAVIRYLRQQQIRRLTFRSTIWR
jgi:hypothetical protein